MQLDNQEERNAYLSFSFQKDLDAYLEKMEGSFRLVNQASPFGHPVSGAMVASIQQNIEEAEPLVDKIVSGLREEGPLGAGAAPLIERYLRDYHSSLRQYLGELREMEHPGAPGFESCAVNPAAPLTV